jgi:hypothetical protein
MNADFKATPGEAQHSHYALELIDSLIPRPTIAPEGWPLAGGLLGAGLATSWLAKRAGWLRPVSQSLTGLGLLAAFVYRNPEREALGQAEDFIYAPADGTLLSISEVAEEPLFIGGPAYRLEITSHIFDVAVLRTPMPGQVLYIHRPPNEAVTHIGLETANGQRLLISCQPDLRTPFRLPSLLTSNSPSLRVQAGQNLPTIAPIGVRGLGIPMLTTLHFPAKGYYILCHTGLHVQAGMTAVGRSDPA